MHNRGRRQRPELSTIRAVVFFWEGMTVKWPWSWTHAVELNSVWLTDLTALDINCLLCERGQLVCIFMTVPITQVPVPCYKCGIVCTFFNEIITWTYTCTTNMLMSEINIHGSLRVNPSCGKPILLSAFLLVREVERWWCFLLVAMPVTDRGWRPFTVRGFISEKKLLSSERSTKTDQDCQICLNMCLK